MGLLEISNVLKLVPQKTKLNVLSNLLKDIKKKTGYRILNNVMRAPENTTVDAITQRYIQLLKKKQINHKINYGRKLETNFGIYTHQTRVQIN
jgi:hypothetical protein